MSEEVKELGDLIVKGLIIGMQDYKNMSDEEIENQLEWSDEQEFGTNYAKYLHNMKKQAIQFIKDELVKIEQETLVDTIIYQEKLNKLLEILGDKENE